MSNRQKQNQNTKLGSKHADRKIRQTLNRNLIGWWRWGSNVLLGLIARLLIDLVYALREEEYPLFSWANLPNYLYTIAFAFIIIEGIRAINRYLDGIFPWEANQKRRFYVQASTNLLYMLFVNNVVRLLFMRVVLPESKIVFQEQIIINIVVTVLLIIVELVDFGIFSLNLWRVSLGEVERFKKESIEFQLATLKAQVNPHFLFNSLNTLSSLVYQNPDSAALFVRRLARVYRYILENQEREMVKLSEEVRCLEDYISLLNTRFGESISFKIDIPKNSRKRFIAPMTLQMLVENAIKHNIKSRKKPLEMTIKLENDKILVSNNLQTKQRVGFSSGIGLQNIQSRYAYLTDHKVEIMFNEERFTVKIPMLDSEKGLKV